MHFRCLPVLLLASLALGQATPASKAAPKTAASSATSKTTKPAAKDSGAITPNTPVITIQGVCDTPAARTKSAAAAKAKPADCKTVVTRAQFEELANAIQPNMIPATKRKLADLYPKMLIMASAARKRGLENDPKFKQILQFARLQILSQELARSVKEDADKVPDADIEKYYKENSPAFEQADLERLFIPKEKQHEANAEKEDPAKQAEAEKADQDAMKKEADSLQTRAAAGEDFDKLQQAAYDTAGVKGTPPSTKIGKLTRNELPVNHRAVLDLKDGQVSQVFAEPNGFYVYKVVAKSTKPLDQAREQIRTTLAQQRMQDAMEAIQQSGKTELNEAYFAVPAPPAPVGAPPAPPQVNPPAKAPDAGKDQGKSESQPPRN